MEFTTCYCPHPQCTHYGQRGFGTHLVRCGADRGIPRLLCTMCQGTFSVRQGTAYFGIRVEEPHDTIAMRALAEGNSLRGTGRIVDVDKDTVCDWVDRAGRHCRAVTTYLFDTLHITECQVDALWSFVRKERSASERGREGVGTLWRCLGVDRLCTRMAPGGRLCGGRTRSSARQRVARAFARG